VNIPGFTAGISLYKTKLHYRLGVGASGVSTLGPQDSYAPNAFVTPMGLPSCCGAKGGCVPPRTTPGGPGGACNSDELACCDINGLVGCCAGCFTQPNESSCGMCCMPPGQCLCGACVMPGENPCAPGQMCCAGACVQVTNNREHCGSCGNKCSSFQQCVTGKCCFPQDELMGLAVLICGIAAEMGKNWGPDCVTTIYEGLETYACPQ
jgi:hypothetical protein